MKKVTRLIAYPIYCLGYGIAAVLMAAATMVAFVSFGLEHMTDE